MGDEPSATIVPRWEWRTFGVKLDAAASRLAAATAEAVQESDELYLLSASDGDTVKLRDGLMDVKQLRQVNDDGLEQWLPTLKASFPLAAADVASVLAGLNLPVAALERSEYTLDQLLGDVVGPSPALLPVEVHKRRQRYRIGGCMAELTDVRADRRATRTVAIEAEDAEAVIETVRELGLGRRRNVNYPRGLRSLVSFGESRYAVIDVGTNSVKFLVAERSADGRWRRIVDRSEFTRLGEGLDASGELGRDPMERTADAIAAMAEEAEDNGALHIAAVGTAPGLRMAPNGAEFVAEVDSRCGVAVEVVSGEDEARLAYRAAISELDLPEASLVAFDSGGGSSQFTFGHGDRVDERFSVEVGAVRFTERFGLDGAVSEEALTEAADTIAADLARLDGRPRPEALVGMGGTITNLAAVKHALAIYDPDVVQGTVLPAAEIDRQIELFRTRSADERRAIRGLQPKRAEVILAGTLIARTIMTKLACESVIVSDRGLRHGVLVERFGTGKLDDTTRERD